MAQLDDAQLLKLLEEADDPDHYEFPRDYDAAALTARIVKWVDDAAAKAGSPVISSLRYLNERLQRPDCFSFDLGPFSHQDCTLHGEVFPPAEWAKPERSSEAGSGLTFSRFGNFVTMLNGDVLKTDKQELIVSTLMSHGFTYIPTRLIRMLTSRDASTAWQSRYFDYL